MLSYGVEKQVTTEVLPSTVWQDMRETATLDLREEVMKGRRVGVVALQRRSRPVACFPEIVEGAVRPAYGVGKLRARYNIGRDQRGKQP